MVDFSLTESREETIPYSRRTDTEDKGVTIVFSRRTDTEDKSRIIPNRHGRNFQVDVRVKEKNGLWTEDTEDTPSESI
jgi:hypothetical protein